MELPRVCESNPSPETVKAAEELFQQVTEDLENNDGSSHPICPYTNEPIPVNFHVIAKDGKVGHVTEGQIAQQIKVMNAAYAAHNVRFELANSKVTINPDWYSNACPESSQQTDMKTALRSGDVKTLNVYSVGFEGCDGLLGYATFPSSYAENKIDDGVVILWEAFPGGSATNYNVGQTLTHETGHWLGLYHTFQGNACVGAGDYVDDTPPELNPTQGCPQMKKTCPGNSVEDLQSGDPIHNYMDYSYDSCMTEFTPLQGDRMRKQVRAFRCREQGSA